MIDRASECKQEVAVLTSLRSNIRQVIHFAPTSSSPSSSFVTGLTAIGVDMAGILRGTHGERRRWVGAEWGGAW